MQSHEAFKFEQMHSHSVKALSISESHTLQTNALDCRLETLVPLGIFLNVFRGNSYTLALLALYVAFECREAQV